MENNTLYHYGVLGMRWGVRRNRSLSSGGSKSKRKSSKSEDYIRAKTLKKKRLSQLSNSELKEINNRMQLENQYKNLKRQHVTVGRKFVNDVAYETVKNISSEYARKYTKKGIQFIGNRLNET